MNEFKLIVDDIVNNEKVLEMKNYKQHYDTDCFTHCYNVAYKCYKISKKMNLDYKSLTRAAMVHDLFLYDWHIKGDRKGFHAFTHGDCACKNASALFDLSDKEKDIIKKHMWPVTLIPPKSIEGFILTLVDKECATEEILNHFIASIN